MVRTGLLLLFLVGATACNKYYLVRPVEITYRTQYILKNPDALLRFSNAIAFEAPFNLERSDTLHAATRARMDSIGVHRVEVRGLGSYDLDQSTFANAPPYVVVLHRYGKSRRGVHEEVTIFRGPAPLPKAVQQYLWSMGQSAVNDTVYARVEGGRGR
ncbi:MAG: hypothetical protein IPI55_05300 [Flavobacteriales bacterium]|nr:hypothetical protein [Flavobacteriales bacterium]